MANTDFDLTSLSGHHTSDRSKANMRKRNWAQVRLQAYGILSIFLAGLALALLVSTIVEKTANVVYEYYLDIGVDIEVTDRDMARINDPNPRVNASLNTVVRKGLTGLIDGELGRSERRELFSILSGDVGLELGKLVKADRSLIGETYMFPALLDDGIQMYLKGNEGALEDAGTIGDAALDAIPDSDLVAVTLAPQALSDARAALRAARANAARLERAEASRQDNAVRIFTERFEAATGEDRARLQASVDQATASRDAANARADALLREATNQSAVFQLAESDPSILIRINRGWIKVTELTQERVVGEVYKPLASMEPAAEGTWEALLMERAESVRQLSDRQIIWIEQFRRSGVLESAFNIRLLSTTDSSNPELAGLWGALVGSFWTMMVTFLIAFPIGILASIYLEEFAPKNRFTDFVEVNINNLAAVPSIVFGLLGLAVFVNGFTFDLFGIDMTIGGFVPRSSPIAGGLVLALMSLPTIIIAGRASIRAVPPSIRDAALGIGASKIQTTTHHVLPLAMPGILTGSIIAMAQALGETAPLLMVGLNAFVQDTPTSPTSASAVLPTLIYRWNNESERLFDDKTAAAIAVLLLFLIAMNALAVLLRKRFERRW